MFFSYKQHRVLKVLLKNYNDKSHTTSNVTEAGKSLSAEELHRRTSYSLDDINLILASLLEAELIEPYNLHGKVGITFYCITNKGKKAFASKDFVWIYKADNIIKVITLIIAVLGLLNSIFDFIKK
ncbi:hypothetical protein [Flavobacterium marginilacus]|uniref:hypothetical protein n=1 Tax=Flavobacterium marginilacus TaxID=3003256 RepID=UPI00248E6184|nr:hypothetical protein [Flavobacterium marginilacus]